jgi:hypothetical protein
MASSENTTQPKTGDHDSKAPTQQAGDPAARPRIESLEAEPHATRPRRLTNYAGTPPSSAPSALPSHMASNIVRHSRAPSIANVSVLDTLFFKDVTTGARAENSNAESPLISPGTSATSVDHLPQPWFGEEVPTLEPEAGSSLSLDPRLALEVSIFNAAGSSIGSELVTSNTPAMMH